MTHAARIGPGPMLALGVGWLGTQFFWAFHTGTLPLFLRGFTDSKFTISLVLSLPGVAACILAPLAGYLSDRTRTPFGRRKPYVVAGMLTTGLCVVALPSAGAFGLVALLALGMYGGVSVAQSPYLALLPDVTPAAQRSTASGVMNLLGSIGLVAYFLVSAAIWEAHPAAVFAMVGAVAVGSVLVALLLLREPPAPPRESAGRHANLGAYVRSVLRETNVLTFFAAQFFWWLGHWMGAAFFTLFVVEELGASEGDSLYVPMAFAVVATLAVLPLGILGDRVGRKSIMTWLMAAWAAVALGLAFAENLSHALLAAGLMGIPFASLMAVNYALLLDLIPSTRTAEFVGLGVISVAVPQILGPLLGGLLIDSFGYRAVFPAGAAAFLTGLAILRFVRVPGAPPAPDAELDRA